MPKIVDYVDRFDDARRAVFDLVLRDGPRNITMTTVAAELGMSSMSLRRMVPDATRLPELGLQWIERQERSYLRRARGGPLSPEHSFADLWNPLLRLVPATSTQAEEAQVRRALTVGFGGSTWATGAQNQHQLLVASRADQAVPDELPLELRGFEVARLQSVVVGATEALCSGSLGPHECLPLVIGHLEERATAWLTEHLPGAP